MFDEALVREAKRDRRSLSVAWIDYRKAFDMVPHAWIDTMLKAIRAPKKCGELSGASYLNGDRV